MIFNYDNQTEIDKLYVHDCVFYGYYYDYNNHVVKMKCFDAVKNIYKDLIFRKVIFVENQSCEFWGPGNSIYDLWFEKDILKGFKSHYMEMVNKEKDLSFLDLFCKYIQICIQLNSGDKIRIICESFELLEVS